MLNVNSMKRYTVASAALVAGAVALSACSASVAAPEPTELNEYGLLPGATLNVAGTVGVPPYGDFGPDGKTVVSFEADMLQKIADDTGVTLEWSVMDFDSVFPAIDSGRSDVASLGVIDRTSRQTKYDFIDNAKDVAGLVAAPAVASAIRSIDDVCGHSIGAPIGTSYVSFWEERSVECESSGKPAIEILTFKNEAVALTALMSGQVETVATQYAVLANFVSKTDGAVEIVKGVEYLEGFTGWVFPKDSIYTEAFLKSFQKLLDDGSYDDIMKKWNLEQLAVTKAALNQGTAE